MSTREKNLQDLLSKARELSAREDLSESETAELEETMAGAKALTTKIQTDRSIDEFEKSISDDVSPRAPEAVSDVRVARDGRFGVFAERKGFESAVKAWKAGEGKQAPWGFDLRYKADVDDATAEVNAGALVMRGESDGNEHVGVISPFYFPGIIEPPTRQPVISDLFAQGSTDSNLVRLVKETVTNPGNSDNPAGGAADPGGSHATSEGAPYATAKIEVSPVDFPVKDITTLLPVTENILMDIPAMSAYLGSRLAKFVQLAEEAEILSGDGTGTHLQGIQNINGRTVLAQGSDDVASAILKLTSKTYQASFLDPSWVLMSPATWAAYATERTDLNGGKGIFLGGPPSLAAVRTVWGLPITVSPLGSG